MSTLYIYIFVMNAESHNAYQWLCLVIVNVFCIWPFLLGIFCFVFYVILIFFIYNTDFNFKICFGTAFGVRYNVLKSMREPFSVSDFISPSYTSLTKHLNKNRLRVVSVSYCFSHFIKNAGIK